MTDLPATLIADPPMEAAHYGIQVSYFGEDGEQIALGHHADRQVIAAFNRHARVHLGLDNIADDRSVRLADFTPLLSRRWATFRKPQLGELDECGIREAQDWMWVVDWADEAALGALPVTVLRY